MPSQRGVLGTCHADATVKAAPAANAHRQPICSARGTASPPIIAVAGIADFWMPKREPETMTGDDPGEVHVGGRLRLRVGHTAEGDEHEHHPVGVSEQCDGEERHTAQQRGEPQRALCAEAFHDARPAAVEVSAPAV